LGDRLHKGERSGARAGVLAAKTCPACGRSIEWRKKWERSWDSVRFCSDACRRNKPGAQDAALEETILRLLHGRGAGKTICPSEAARMVAGGGALSDDRAAWEPLMEPPAQQRAGSSLQSASSSCRVGMWSILPRRRGRSASAALNRYGCALSLLVSTNSFGSDNARHRCLL